MARNLRGYTRRNLRKWKFPGFIEAIGVTGWIIIINVLVFIFGIILIYIDESFWRYFALQPISFLQGKYLWTV